MKCKYLSLLACAGFVALFSTTSTANAKPKPLLDSAQSFAVLGGSAVTLTDSAVIGDVGVVDLNGALTQTRSTNSGTVHLGDQVAQYAYDDFLDAYADLAAEPCGTVLTGTLAGAMLVPGVYCFDAAAELTGTLTLVGSSTDTWIFKIGTVGGGALTGTDFTVVMTSGETCNNNVFWWTADAATLTRSVFIGSILAGTSITMTDTTFGGQALATVEVTLTDNTSVSVCGKKPKANEGVGNGVDGNTPGHDHNGGNDDPAFSPGNPGATNK